MGDVIIFLKEPSREEQIETIVTNLIYFSSVKEFIKEIPVKKLNPSKESNIYITDWNQFCPLEKQKQYGIVTFA
ncbi:MAG: hypothetical protein PUB18_01790 [bacterium]|nr:hypothetical protein [bacterium]